MRQDAIGVELWGAAVWLAAGLVAFALPAVVGVPMASAGPALFETVFGLPMAGWLALLTAQALSRGDWGVLGGRAVPVAAEPSAFWVFTGVAILISGVFLAGFLRGMLSLIALA